MANVFLKFTGKINRRLPRDEGDPNEPYSRENWLSRDGRLTKPLGTIEVISSLLTGIPTWGCRYHTVETGQVSPKTFAYTQDGCLWFINELAKTATLIKSGLNLNAYPNSCFIKSSTQMKLYLVDGRDLYVYDGNNDNRFDKVDIKLADGSAINPIDLIEHLDRLILVSKTDFYVSKNLDFEVFNNSTDCADIIVGSGKGTNQSLRKLGPNLFILNTEGFFGLFGDTISALAPTFEIRLIEEKRPISGRTAVVVEGAIYYLADDYNVWSFNGASSKKLTHELKLEDFVNKNRTALDKAVATYYNNYYMLSFVETGSVYNNLEVWYDAIEAKPEIIRGRNVSYYMQSDPTIENLFLQLGRSDINMVMWADKGYNFGGTAINTKLWTRDIKPKEGRNVRFTSFYPKIEPIGDRNLDIIYLLDGRQANIDHTEVKWSQNLQGESKTFGLITIKNQSQVTYSVRPMINYAKGTSIAFYINDVVLNARTDFLGIGIEYELREFKKTRIIGG